MQDCVGQHTFMTGVESAAMVWWKFVEAVTCFYEDSYACMRMNG